jgi:SAM-dependent methyltransferase
LGRHNLGNGNAVVVPHDIFDEQIAASYDSGYMSDPAVVDPAVDFLADLAGEGAALELGIGTGRIGLPLSQRGVPVSGIEISEAMVAKLEEKPGADAIDVTIGDFATARAPGTFRVAFLVYNTISNLTTQDEQVECFCNVAEHLEPGGCFVIELGVPGLRSLPPGESFHVFQFSPDHVGIDEYDVANQRQVSHHFGPRHGYVFSSQHRYAWPAELDLMARIAGMTLRERWAGWQREPFTSESVHHISVWEKPA